MLKNYPKYKYYLVLFGGKSLKNTKIGVLGTKKHKMARHKIMGKLKVRGSRHTTPWSNAEKAAAPAGVTVEWLINTRHLLSELPEVPVGHMVGQLHTKSSEWTPEAKSNELSVF